MLGRSLLKSVSSAFKVEKTSGRLSERGSQAARELVSGISAMSKTEKLQLLGKLAGATIVVAGISVAAADFLNLSPQEMVKGFEAMTPEERSNFVALLSQFSPDAAAAVAAMANVLTDPSSALVPGAEMDRNHMAPIVALDGDEEPIVIKMKDVIDMQRYTRAWMQLTRYIPRESIEFLIDVVSRMPLETRNALEDNARMLRSGR